MAASNRTALAVGCANLLPLAGVALFDWQPVTVLLVYWFEIGFVFLAYGVAALFAPGDPDRNEYRVPVPTIEVPGAGRGQLHVLDRLPPIHGRNLSYAVALFLFGPVIWAGFSQIVILASSESLPDTDPDARGGPFWEFVATEATVISTVISPAVLLVVGALFVSQALSLRNEFATSDQQLPASTVAMMPYRLALFLVALVVVATLVTLVVVLALVVFDRPAMGETIGGLGFVTALVCGKLLVELRRLDPSNS